mgnify:CR=1 FL=1
MKAIPALASEAFTIGRGIQMKRSFAIAVSLLIGVSSLITEFQAEPANAQSNQLKPTDQAKLAKLKRERDRLWNELISWGGAATPKQAIDNVNHRMTTRKLQIDGLNDSLKKLAGGKKAVEKLKTKIENTPVIGLTDVAEEVGEKAGEYGVGLFLKTIGKRVVGVAGLLGDIAEYGGKKYFKGLDLEALEELVERNRINIEDAIRLQRALLNDNDKDRKLRDKLVSLRARYDEADERYLMEKQTQAKSSGANSDEPKQIADFCYYVPVGKARRGCYGAWRKQCAGALNTKHMKECYAVIDAASAGDSQGKIRNVCSQMKPKYKKACYGFGKLVRRLCQMIPHGPERAECVKNVRRIPQQAAVGR